MVFAGWDLSIILTSQWEKPTHIQKNNARGKAIRSLLYSYFADFEKAFAAWDTTQPVKNCPKSEK